MSRAVVAGMVWLSMLAVHATPAQMCIGDCDHTGTVTIGNVITVVDIALGTAQPSACTDGLPSNAGVDIGVSVQAVNNALDGCPTPITPGTPTTAPATATDTPATVTPPPSPGESATETPTSAATSTRTPIPTQTATAPPAPTRTNTATQTATNPPASTATPRPSATPRPTTHTVEVGPSGMLVFSPSDLTINVGDTVLWKWSSSGHNVVSGSDCTADSQFCSPSDNGCDQSALSSKGATYQHTFTAAGTYPYFCSAHCGLGMVGSITVQ